MNDIFGSGYCPNCWNTHKECTCPQFHTITTNKTTMTQEKPYWTVTTTFEDYQIFYEIVK